MAGATGTDGRGRPSKVARVIEEYDLTGLGAELEALWTAAGDDRHSLRDLATLTNRRLLAAALEAAGHHSLTGEAANLHRLMTDDAVGAADRTRARRRLEREGVDVEALEADFVSYQAVRTYLQGVRDAEYEDASDPVASAETTIRRLQGRLATVTESKLAGASDTDDLALGDVDVTVSVRVACRDCGDQTDVASLLEAGGCGCGDAS